MRRGGCITSSHLSKAFHKPSAEGQQREKFSNGRKHSSIPTSHLGSAKKPGDGRSRGIAFTRCVSLNLLFIYRKLDVDQKTRIPAIHSSRYLLDCSSRSSWLCQLRRKSSIGRWIPPTNGSFLHGIQSMGWKQTLAIIRSLITPYQKGRTRKSLCGAVPNILGTLMH